MTIEISPVEDRWVAFDTLAATYQVRPGYSEEALVALVELLESAKAGRHVMIDVGAGTGIFTRQLAEYFPEADVIGLEPNAAMRQVASQASQETINYLDATASSLPFEAQSLSVVAAAGAVHRFDRPAFFAEAARVLKPEGVLMLLDNPARPEGARFHSEYLSLQEGLVPAFRRGMNSDGFGGYIDMDLVGELATHTEFNHVHQGAWPFDDYLDEDRFLALAESSSINIKAMRQIGRDPFLEQVKVLHRAHANAHGFVRMSFLTVATFARRGAL